jgi:hypothetical protein
MQVGRGAWRRSETGQQAGGARTLRGTLARRRRCDGRWAAGRLRWGQGTVCGHESRLFRRLEARVRREVANPLDWDIRSSYSTRGLDQLLPVGHIGAR